MESLPLELVSFLAHFRPLMRAEVFDTFSYLLCGLLIGVRLARHGARLGLRPGYLSAATLERPVLPAQALAASTDGAVDSSRLVHALSGATAGALVLAR